MKWQLDLRTRKCDFSRNVKCNLSKDLSNMFPKTSVVESGAREKQSRKTLLLLLFFPLSSHYALILSFHLYVCM